MKHGLQIFASAMFFAVIVFMVWYMICGMQGAEEGPEGTLVFHEVNTIPGFTPHSRFPSMMQAAGLSFREVLSCILDAALEEA